MITTIEIMKATARATVDGLTREEGLRAYLETKTRADYEAYCESHQSFVNPDSKLAFRATGEAEPKRQFYLATEWPDPDTVAWTLV